MCQKNNTFVSALNRFIRLSSKKFSFNKSIFSLCIVLIAIMSLISCQEPVVSTPAPPAYAASKIPVPSIITPKATDVTKDSIKVQWDELDVSKAKKKDGTAINADEIKIAVFYRKWTNSAPPTTGSVTAGTLAQELSGDMQEITITGLESNSTYFIALKTINASEAPQVSAQELSSDAPQKFVTVSDATAVAVPTITTPVAADTTYNSIVVKWVAAAALTATDKKGDGTALTASDVDIEVFYLHKTKGDTEPSVAEILASNTSVIQNGLTNSITINGLKLDSDYYVVLKTINKTDTRLTMDGTAKQKYTTPATARSSTAQITGISEQRPGELSTDSIIVKWTPLDFSVTPTLPATEVNLELYYKKGALRTATAAAVVPTRAEITAANKYASTLTANNTQATITGLDDGVYYYVVLKSINSNDTSQTELSDVYKFTTYKTGYAPTTKVDLRNLVVQEITKQGNSADLNIINTRAITNMYNLIPYENISVFTGDVSLWDVSNVTDFSLLFYGADQFNGDLSKWDVRNATTMADMFNGAYNFNGDLSKWNIGKVESISGMFRDAWEFNSDISKWDVSNVTTMEITFYNAKKFNSDISEWKVGKVKNMTDTFAGAVVFNSGLTHWDVSNVTSMKSMFYGNKVFDGDVSLWNVSKVENMEAMFAQTDAFNGYIAKWNVSNVTNMKNMFNQAKSFNGDISEWQVTSVENMSGMFEYAEVFNSDLGNWKVDKVTDMSRMFYTTNAFNRDLNKWNVTNVNNMFWMFRKATLFNGNIKDWNLVNVTDMSAMFFDASAFKQDLSNWGAKVGNVTTWDFYDDYIFENSGLDGNEPTWCTTTIVAPATKKCKP